MFRKTQGEPLKLDHAFAYVWLPSSWPLPRAGFLKLAPGITIRVTTTSVKSQSVFQHHQDLPWAMLLAHHPFPGLRDKWYLTQDVIFAVWLYLFSKLQKPLETYPSLWVLPTLWVTQLCLTLCDSTDYNSPPGSSVHGVLQAGTLEWVAISFSRGFFPTQASNLGLLHHTQILYHLSP